VPTPAELAERYMLRAQNSDGGFGAAPGQSSSQLYSGWSGLGLAVAGHNARDLRRGGGRSLASYLKRNARSVRDIGEVERTVLLLESAGISSRRFGGRDLVAAIRNRRRADGAIAGFVSYTAFGILALKSAGVSAGRSTVAWLVSAQNDDGGFGLTASAASDSDMTGASLQALAAAGRARSGSAQRAVAWLRANQNDDGGFGQFRGRSSNAQSTSYAIQGLVAADAGGATLTRALAYLRGLQRRDGSVAYSSSSAQTPVWVTAQALMALKRTPLPLAAVPREKRTRASSGGESDTTAAAPPASGGATTGGDGAAAAPATPADDAAPAAARAVTPAAVAKRQAARAAALAGGGEVLSEEDGVAPGPLLEDNATAAADRAGDDGVPVGIVAAAVLAALAAVALLRRRLVPRRFRRSGDAVT
jgi:prenyltransferase beta subunit